MLPRKALLIALVVAPFVYSPSEASAQRGLDRAAVATARADEVGAAQNSNARQDLPPGIERRFAGQTLPPGIRRTRPAPPTTGDDSGSTGDDTTTDATPVCLLYETVWVGFSVTQQCVLWSTP